MYTYRYIFINIYIYIKNTHIPCFAQDDFVDFAAPRVPLPETSSTRHAPSYPGHWTTMAIATGKEHATMPRTCGFMQQTRGHSPVKVITWDFGGCDKEKYENGDPTDKIQILLTRG